jgi:hypothetical protein
MHDNYLTHKAPRIHRCQGQGPYDCFSQSSSCLPCSIHQVHEKKKQKTQWASDF